MKIVGLVALVAHPAAAGQAVGADVGDFAHGAAVDLVDQGGPGRGMAALQAGRIFTPFFSASSPARSMRCRPIGIGGKGLLHEDIDALLHRVFDVDGADVGPGGAHGNVAGAQDVDGLLVGVEAQEHPVRRHVGMVRKLLFDRFELALHGADVEVRHGVQLDGSLVGGVEGVNHRSGTPASGPDQGQSDGVVVGNVNAGGRLAQNGRASHQGAASLGDPSQELPAGGGGRLGD